MKYSLIIPCYNEERNLKILLNKCSGIVKNNNYEIIIVNNGSKDNSRKILNTIIKKYNNIKILHIKKNIGYGNGIVQGLKFSKGDILGWTHADLQTDPSDFLKATSFFKSPNDKIYVKGLRTGRKFSDLFFTIIMSVFESILFRTILRDINAQPNVFTRKFFTTLKNFPDDFSLDLFFFINAKKIKKLKIYRFPVLFKQRIHGISNWNFDLRSKIKFILKILNYSIKLKKFYKL